MIVNSNGFGGWFITCTELVGDFDGLDVGNFVVTLVKFELDTENELLFLDINMEIIDEPSIKFGTRDMNPNTMRKIIIMIIICHCSFLIVFVVFDMLISKRSPKNLINYHLGPNV